MEGFIFKLNGLLEQAKKLSQLEGVAINLPFLSLNMKVEDHEKKVAGETVIFLKNKRVFQPRKLGEHDIQAEIGFLRDIRKFLVEQEMKLVNQTDGALYLMMELMLEVIRQFLSFQKKLSAQDKDETDYHAIFELLQTHLSNCIAQVYKIADVKLPEVYVYFNCDEKWHLKAYQPPAR